MIALRANPGVHYRCLSIPQPGAWLILNGYQDICNIKWPTIYRGYFLIQVPEEIDQAAIRYATRELGITSLPDSYQTGGIVGYGRIDYTVRRSLSSWYKGPYGFVVHDATPVEFVPCPAGKGFFKVVIHHQEGDL